MLELKDKEKLMKALRPFKMQVIFILLRYRTKNETVTS